MDIRHSNNFTMILLRWFAENGRDLPWRNTRNPYAIWLSEVILQQTRVAQGRAYWERFMQRFPRVEDLAVASEDEVLRLWQGLGYYSRARNLHYAARQIVELGGFPKTIEGLRQLKGVGDYTAAAIGSIAFGLPEAVVDGNVYRVLARCFGIDTPINSSEGKKIFSTLAQSLLPHSLPDGCLTTGNEDALSAPSMYNQAVMDFGAMVCTPASPRCLLCPLGEICDALRTRRVSTLPVKLKTVKVKTRRLAYVYIRCKGETVIRKRPEGDIWQGLWEPFVVEMGEEKTVDNIGKQRQSTVDASKDGEAAPLLNDEFGRLLPSSMRQWPLIQLRKNVKHVLTHRILMADFYLLETDVWPDLPDGYLRIAEQDIDDYGKPRLFELLLETLPER